MAHEPEFHKIAKTSSLQAFSKLLMSDFYCLIVRHRLNSTALLPHQA